MSLCGSWSGSKQLLKEVFEKVKYEESQQTETNNNVKHAGQHYILLRILTIDWKKN